MVLSGLEIKNRLDGDIVIRPFEADNLNPHSYNLTLHDELLIYENNILDLKKDNPTRSITIPEEGFVLMPGQVYLATTQEYTETYNLEPTIHGRSSAGRLGLSVYTDAGYGDSGYKGYWTLMLSCKIPIRIYAGVKICQIKYTEIKGEIEHYKGKYQNATAAMSSKLYEEF